MLVVQCTVPSIPSLPPILSFHLCICNEYSVPVPWTGLQVCMRLIMRGTLQSLPCKYSWLLARHFGRSLRRSINTHPRIRIRISFISMWTCDSIQIESEISLVKMPNPRTVPRHLNLYRTFVHNGCAHWTEVKWTEILSWRRHTINVHGGTP